MRVRPPADEDAEEIVKLSVELKILGKRRRFDTEIPNRPSRPRHLLPLFRDITNAGIEASTQKVVAEGKAVSCKPGCAACCRQLVPLTQTEAHVFRDLVEDLPPTERRAVERRFAAAKTKLRDAGLLDELADIERLQKLSNEEYSALGLRYVDAAVDCPFLVEESCSIYAERPLVCREFLVTTPPIECSRPGPGIESVPIVSDFALSLEEIDGAKRAWVPLVLAPEWANDNPDVAEPSAPTEIANRFLARVGANVQYTK